METVMNPSDHDLLVQVNIKLERVIADVKELKEDTARRVAVLETHKLERQEFESALKSGTEIHDDHERRLRFLERYIWIAIGALGIIEIILTAYLTLKK